MTADLLNTKLLHPRDQIALVISRIYRRGLTTTSGGNISIIDEQGDIWVTPSAVDKGSLTPADIVCVKRDGTIIGQHQPSSEFPFHRAIYAVRPDIKAVIHAHPPALVSFSIARKVPHTHILLQARQVCGAVGYAPYRLPGSQALGEVIAGQFAHGHASVIMENHGTVVGGSDLGDCFQRFETLELCARTLLYSHQIGEPVCLSEEDVDAYEAQRPAFLPEMDGVEHPSDEREKRQQICAIVRRACRQGLMISSYGTISARWRGHDFLITPTGKPRWDLQEEDIVQIKEGRREPGRRHSRMAHLHQEIYRRHPEINSIISTQSPYLMAFAVTGAHFDVRTIPESWIFLQDVPCLPFTAHDAGRPEVADLLSRNQPAVMLRNDCIIVAGDSLLQTFDYLEVAEFSAQSLVMSTPLGRMVPISGEQVEELRMAFLK